MLIIPKGPAAEPVYLLRRMTAMSETFREFTRTPDTKHALTRVKLKEVEGDEPKPCAVINTESTMFHNIADGVQPVIVPKGTLFLWLALETPDELRDDPDGEFLNYLNFHGGVGEDIAKLSGVDQTEDAVFPDSHLLITEMHDVAPSVSPKEYWESLGRFMWSAWIVRWGTEE